MKKFITSSLVTTTLLSSLALSTSIVAAAPNNIPSHSSSLIVKDSINDWMPNKGLQSSVLASLIKNGLLPEGSTVDDITQELLGKIPYNMPMDLVVTSDSSEINSLTLKGVEFLNEANLNITIASDNQDNLLNVDTSYIPNSIIFNVHQKALVNPHAVLTKKLLQDVELGTKSYSAGVANSFQGQNMNWETGDFTPFISGSISLDNYKNISIKTSDLRDFNYPDNYSGGTLGAIFDTQEHKIVSDGAAYNFVADNESGILSGTFNSNSVNNDLIEKAKTDPSRYIILIQDTARYQNGSKVNLSIGVSNKFMSFDNATIKNVKININDLKQAKDYSF